MKRTKSLFHYLAFFPITVLALIVIGNINLWFFQDFVGWYKGVNPSEVNIYSLVALLLYNLVIVTVSRKNWQFQKQKLSIEELRENISKEKLSKIIIVFSVIGAVANFINFYSFGGIPVLVTKLTGFERFDFAKTIIIPRFPILSSVSVLLTLVYLSIFRDRRIFMFVLLVVSLFLSYAIGSRHLLMEPIVLFLLMAVNLINLKMRNQLLLIVIIPLSVVSLLSLRGEKVQVSSINEGISILGGEYRDFILLREKFNYDELLYGKSFISIIINPIPEFFLFGAKKEDLQLYTAYIAEDIWGSTTGIRVGIWGEFFMNFGLTGMVVLFFLLAFPVKILARNIFKNFNKYFLLNYSYLLLMFGTIGSWGTIGDDLGSFGVAYFFVYYFVLRKKEVRIVNG